MKNIRKVLLVALMAVAILGSSLISRPSVLDKMANGVSPAPHAVLAMDAKEILEVGIPKLLM